jgi:Protein of unknown function (DUF433)
MNPEITLVNRGRGLQLSTSRITVQDLVPYFQARCSHEEILRWMPTLCEEEIRIVEEYYRAHQQELDQEDVLIRRAQAERRRRFYEQFPPQSEEVRRARLQEFLEERLREKLGAGNPG